MAGNKTQQQHTEQQKLKAAPRTKAQAELAVGQEQAGGRHSGRSRRQKAGAGPELTVLCSSNLTVDKTYINNARPNAIKVHYGKILGK